MNNRIIPILRYHTSCDYHRINVPLAQMGIDISSQKPLTEESLIVFNRMPNIEVSEFIAKKYRYIIDIDDYWQLDTSHYLYKHLMPNGYATKHVDLIKHASAVTVTNSRLADKVRPFNKNVHVVPNTIPFGKGQFTGQPKRAGKIKFVYAGGNSHLDDVKLIANHIEQSTIDFTLAGYNDQNEQCVKIKSLFKGVKTIPELKVNSYMELYDSMDVSLVPLVKNEFNLCKSNLKILEAGCKGMSVISSATEPYLVSGEAKYVDYCSNSFEWLNMLRYYKKNPNYVREKGEALGEFVKSRYDMKTANELRRQIYNHELSKI